MVAQPEIIVSVASSLKSTITLIMWLLAFVGLRALNAQKGIQNRKCAVCLINTQKSANIFLCSNGTTKMLLILLQNEVLSVIHFITMRIIISMLNEDLAALVVH